MVQLEREDGQRAMAPTRFEALLAGAPGPLAPHFAAAAARARTRVPAAPAEAALRDVAAGVAAPVLVGYAAWILRDAARRGLARVYFLARDGQVLLEVAERLAPRLGLDLECRYLYASRQGWLRNVADLGSTDAGHWLWWGVWQGFVPGETTLANLKRRLGAPGPDLDAALAAAGFPAEAHGRPLDAAAVERLEAFFRSEAFGAALAGSRAENRRLFRAYLAQEGLFDGTPAGIVDIGWAGNLHAGLAAMQQAEGVAPAHGYYFGFNEKRLAAFAEARSRFQYDFEDGPEPAFKPGFHQELVEIYLEIFCAADHGTLTGFRPEGGRIAPVLAAGAAARMRAFGLPLYRRTLLAVVDALDPAALDLAALEGMRGPIRDLLEAFWMRPTPEEVRAWGAFPVEIGEGDGGRALALAEPYRPADLPGLLAGRTGLRKHKYFWVEGGLALTPPPLRASLRTLRAARARLRPGAA